MEYFLNPKSYLNEDGIYAFLTLNLHQNIVDINLINEMLTNMYFDTGIANTSKEDFASFFYDTGVDIDPYYLFIKTIEENGTNIYKDNIKDYSKYINGEIKKYVFGGLNANNGTAYNDTVNMSPDDWNTPIKGLKGLAEFTVQKYVNKGKNTSYLLRFDLNSICIGNDPVQYSTASNIAMSHSKLYKKIFVIINFL